MKRVRIWPAGKVFGAIYAVLGLLICLVFALLTALGPGPWDSG